MTLLEIYLIASLAFLILEMLIPTAFFLNLAIAGLGTAISTLYMGDWVCLALTFVAFSLLSILYLRPILLRRKETREQKTGMEDKYIEKIVKVIEPVSKHKGAITVYDERWEARTECDEEIEIDAYVVIVKYDGLILTVERI